MTKTTKVIAALGVVAGLGVAALPAFTYADGQSVTGDSHIYVRIPNAIAMTITGNNDDQSCYADSSISPVIAANGSKVINAETITGTTVDYTDEGTVDGLEVTSTNKTSDGVNATTKTLTESTKGASSACVTLNQNAADLTTAFNTVTVYTNNGAGYTLSAKAKTANLVNGDYHIDPLTAGTAPAAGDGTWGFKLSTTDTDIKTGEGIASGYDDWAVVPSASAQTIASESVATTGGTAYKVQYGVGTKADQAAGVYKDTVTFTATAQ